MRRGSKFRGSRTHGRGKKAGRGAGKRGGRGRSGLHKHKFISIVKYDPKHFGRHGFKRPVPKEEVKTLDFDKLESHLENLVKKGHAKRMGDKIQVDLKAAGYDKLLGTGTPMKNLEIKVPKATPKAISKVEKGGGKVATDEEENEVE
jgi:large subunit ribosomal protein L15